MKKRKICVLTGSRADYGSLYWLIQSLSQDPRFLLQLVVTGAHLSKKFGNTYRQIERDGFRIDEKVPIVSGANDSFGVTESLGKATLGFAGTLKRLKPEMLILYGDRYEMLAAAQAALIAKIPVAHIAGGDTTLGVFDEAVRHSISKMAHLHFVTNEISARRVAQLGENPRHIFNVGFLGIDPINRLDALDRETVGEKLNFKWKPKNLLVTFHPVTLERLPSAQQFQQLLNALDRLGSGVGLIFTSPNSDPEGMEILRMIRKFIRNKPHAKAYDSLGTQLYLSLLRHVDAVVGNSSSGIYEAPSFKKPTVDIGDRQKGRLRASSVIHCEPNQGAILKGIREALRMDCREVVNPYGEGNAHEKILDVLRAIPQPAALLKKSFQDWTPSSAKPVYIIAEAGVNHNGSLSLAKKLIDRAAEAGADAIKFQTFRADEVVTRAAEKADYQKKITGTQESQWEMIKKLELDLPMHQALLAHCKKKKIHFLSTPCDAPSVDLLANKLKLRRLKISSCDVTNAPLLLKIARTGLPLILSTGMSTLEEIEEALAVIAFGYTQPMAAKPGALDFKSAYLSAEGQRLLKERVILLHCTTEYPAPPSEMNLNALTTLARKFGLPVGLSDHSAGILASLAAVSMGAVVIEKHFTLSCDLPGPDHKASLEPTTLKTMVRSIRDIEILLGDGRKIPTASELRNRPLVRKSLVAARRIPKGARFTSKNITSKRPESGQKPFQLWSLLGSKARRDYQKDEIIEA